MIILTILLPFNYYNVSYYFDSLEQLLFFFMLLAPCIIIYESINGVKNYAIVYYVILGIALVFCSLVNIFNSGVLIGSFIQLIYLLFLVIPNYKQKRIPSNLNKLKLIKFLYIEIISLVVYLYYYINPGDLFFSKVSPIDIVYITETPVGKFFHLNIIFLLIAMIVRIANFKLITKVFDLIWIAWVMYFTLIILIEYILNPNYITTDGMFLMIPPILICLYMIKYPIYKLVTLQTNKIKTI